MPSQVVQLEAIEGTGLLMDSAFQQPIIEMGKSWSGSSQAGGWAGLAGASNDE